MRSADAHVTVVLCVRHERVVRRSALELEFEVIRISASLSADAWHRALPSTICRTMENALLGDSMIEKLRSAGTAAEKEKDDVMQKLQEQVRNQDACGAAVVAG